jgi:hypothetical protein
MQNYNFYAHVLEGYLNTKININALKWYTGSFKSCINLGNVFLENSY